MSARGRTADQERPGHRSGRLPPPSPHHGAPVSNPCAPRLRRALVSNVRTVVALLAVVVAVLAAALARPGAASAATTYTGYVRYASAPAEVIGKTAAGYRLLTPAEAAAVPPDAVTYLANTQFLRVGTTGPIYKVSSDLVSTVTTAQWTAQGTPTPRIVDRVPAMEYSSYASNPSEIIVRTPVGVWRHATAAETASIPASSVTYRADTYYLSSVGSSQVVKRVAGVSTPITTAQWRAEGSPTPMVPPVPSVGTDPFTTAAPYVDPDYPSVAAAAALRASGDTTDAAVLDRISAHGGTRWLGSGNTIATVAATTSAYVGAAVAAGRTGTLVVYGIPGRDCGSYSAGGFSATDYPRWIAQIAAGIAHRRVAVVLEPDALLQLGRCPDVQGDRTGLLRAAATTLTAAGATVYLDAGTSNSGVDTATMVSRLLAAGVQGVRGFAVNVSNYKSTSDVQAYADEVSRLLGGAHYVIDTSRNGNGSDGEWCNARGRAIGQAPAASSHGNEDAALWIKTVGASDGTCNGGPAAGTWWNTIALELARNAGY
ncbi:endoglucanase [Curtobacterium sp. MCBD17_028]|nr:endoglucanase [Curtobacterium sp. MCBD17_028]